MKMLLSAVLSTALVAAPIAHAVEPAAHAHPARHGTVKPMDHRQSPAREFAQLDKDKNGFLAKSEVAAPHPMAAHFDMLDRNRDGKLSRKEFASSHSMH